MAMNLGDLLGMIRQDYLDTWQATANEATGSGGTMMIEPSATAQAPSFGAVLWHDLQLNGKATSVQSEGVFAFDEQISFGWGDALPGQAEPLHVVVRPFAWDAMPVALKLPQGKALNLEPLGQWLEQWSAEPEPDAVDETSPFREVAHSLTQTSPTSLHVDMGSAPLDAWQDLLEALLAAGATQAIFGGPQG
jgi:hypothetical protein